MGRNLTLANYTIGTDGYVIKAFNKTSGHFAYFAYIGNFTLPKAYSFTVPLTIDGIARGSADAGSFETTVHVPVKGEMIRPLNSTVQANSRLQHLGTWTLALNYTDKQVQRSIQYSFAIEVWTSTSILSYLPSMPNIVVLLPADLTESQVQRIAIMNRGGLRIERD